MNVRLAAIGAASALVAAMGCRDATSPTVIDLGARLSVWVPDSAAVLAHEDYSGFSTATRAVVADGQSWAGTWAQLYSGTQPKPPQPDIDFTKDCVIVAALGGRPTGGFGINIDSIVGYNGGTVVYVTTSAPGPNSATTQLFTQPVELVRLTRPPEPIVFQERAVGGGGP